MSRQSGQNPHSTSDLQQSQAMALKHAGWRPLLQDRESCIGHNSCLHKTHYSAQLQLSSIWVVQILFKFNEQIQIYKLYRTEKQCQNWDNITTIQSYLYLSMILLADANESSPPSVSWFVPVELPLLLLRKTYAAPATKANVNRVETTLPKIHNVMMLPIPSTASFATGRGTVAGTTLAKLLVIPLATPRRAGSWLLPSPCLAYVTRLLWSDCFCNVRLKGCSVGLAANRSGEEGLEIHLWARQLETVQTTIASKDMATLSN